MTDLSLRLMRDGYRAVAKDRAARGGGATYVSRLFGRRTVVLGDAAGAVTFYDESLVRRRRAIPPPLAWLLFGRGAIHGLDADPHRDRKLLFLDLLSPEDLDPLLAETTVRLDRAIAAWPRRDVVLFDELVRVYGGAVLAWAGLDLDDAESDRISRRLATVVDGFGGRGFAFAGAWRDRVWANRWAEGLVEQTRRGAITAPEGSPLAVIAAVPDLDSRTAGVELLNVLRPTVAVAWLGTFAGLALTRVPQWRERLRGEGSVHERYAFAQEVRRTTPFAPVLTGLAVRSATHGGVLIRPRDRLVLDIIGIDHDPAYWPEPTEFRPDRFLDDREHGGRVPGAFELVPQGCPGESVALSLLMATAERLASVDFEVFGSAEVDLSRIPTLPTHGLRLTEVSPAGVTGSQRAREVPRR